MKTLSNKTYITILISSTIIFCILMAFILKEFKYAIWDREFTSLSYRLESLEDSIEYGDSSMLWQTLYYDNSVEPEFNSYWNLAIVEQYYLQGLTLRRALEEGDSSAQKEMHTCMSYIENYIANESNLLHQNIAKEYLNILSKD